MPLSLSLKWSKMSDPFSELQYISEVLQFVVDVVLLDVQLKS